MNKSDTVVRLPQKPQPIDPKNPPDLVTVMAHELMAKDIPDVKWIVPGRLSEGLTMLVGKPKVGKSWLSLAIGIAVATGGEVLGKHRVDGGDVLYLALEDNDRRLKKRLTQMVPDGTTLPRRLALSMSCQRLDQGGLIQIERWLKGAKDAKLVIVDVLNRVKPKNVSKQQQYEADAESLQGLQSLANKYSIAVLLVHHRRKSEAGEDGDLFDTVSGTAGLAGTADDTWILARDGSKGTILYGRGRNIEEFEVAVSFDKRTGTWKEEGNASEVNLGRTITALRLAMGQDLREWTAAELAEETGIKRDTVKKTLPRMVQKGLAEKGKERGRYQYCEAPTVSRVEAE